MKSKKKIYIHNSQTKEIASKVDKLREIGQRYGFYQVFDHEEANIITSIGGDGAFLQAIRKTGFREDCLYVGVNDNRLGFYTDFNLEDEAEIERGFQANLLEVQKYPVIDVVVNGNHHFKCMNEVTIRSNIIKSIAIDVFIDDFHFETFRGDGMIISTPTGSTAYNKSLKGAIIDPHLKAMQLTEIASLNSNEYRTIDSPVILSGDRVLTLKIIQEGNEHPIIAADNDSFGIRNIHEIKVKISNTEIKTLKLKENSFFHKVKKSFL